MTSPDTPPPEARPPDPAMPRPSITERLLFAVPAALVYGLIMYALIWSGDASDNPLPFFGGLLFFPMAIASVATIAADPRGEGRLKRNIKIGWICITLFILLSFVVLREGGICVAMAAPFFFAGSALGSWLTFLCLRKLRSRSVASCFMALPLFGLPGAPSAPAPPLEDQVQTVMDIDAPPQVVWRNTVEIPEIRPEERRWTFSHNIVGVPRPIDARIDSQGVGAVRHLRWTKGVTFEEVVTGWQQDRALSWTFRFGPGSIPKAVEGHIKVDSPYLKLLGGEYRLSPLPQGRTRLTLTTRYRIATPINAYCDLWGHLFLNDFHGAVLNVIRQRSERQAHSA
ncbi:SRPBCC family protein [Novosphingobium terrae]|uniref:hypothetical protein n=1 Tax=Novosphingobium terrae TaxID=2726189 RepID=UPI0019810902|nr:hypothetical protein [Novosphingobium terrae]